MNKTERITFRLDNKEKEEIILYSKELNMSLSDYVYQAVIEKMKNKKLDESQSKLIEVIKIGFKESVNPLYRQIALILNRLDFNSKWLLKQQDIFMQHIKVPQSKEDLIISPEPHPITEKAEELVLKDIKKMAAKKRGLEEEED